MDPFQFFNPMAEDYTNSLSKEYYGGPGFAIPDTKNGLNEPLNILVDCIPSGLQREGLVRAFGIAGVPIINCKVFKFESQTKAIVHVKSITDATTAIQALNNKPPLNLRVTLAAKKEDFEHKKAKIQREQREELSRHLRILSKPLTKMGELVSNLRAVENLFKILPTKSHPCFACESERLVRHVHFIADQEVVMDPFDGLPESIPVSCSFCAANEGHFIVCEQCRIVAYCGLRCQTMAWGTHKKVCVPHPKIPRLEYSPIKEPVKKMNMESSPLDLPNNTKTNEVKPKESTVNSFDKKLNNGYERKSPDKPKIDRPSTAQLSPKKIKDNIAVEKPKPKPETVTHRNEEPKKIVEKPQPQPQLEIRPTNPVRDETIKIVKPRPKISLNNEVSFMLKTKLPVNEACQIIFSFCYSPSEFYVQRLEDGEIAETITKKLGDTCAEAKEWVGADKLQPEQYCAAMFPEDEYWYRAKILRFDGSFAEVKFIDYGNKHEVPKEYLQPLPPELTTIPALAVCCSLKYVKPSNGSVWIKEASKFFEDCLLDETESSFNICKVIHDMDNVHYVELENNFGNTISDLLIEKGYAWRFEEIRRLHPNRMRRNLALNSPPEDRIKSKIAPESVVVEPVHQNFEVRSHSEIRVENNDRKFERTGKVTPTQSETSSTASSTKELSPSEAFKQKCREITPANYYHLYKMGAPPKKEAVLLYNDPEDTSIVYTLGNNEAMLALCEVLSVIEKKGKKIKPEAGIFAVAPAEDGDFYRVLILEVLNDKMSRVFYLDFGNTDDVANTCFLKLPSKIGLEKIPAQGIRCRVVNATEIENYEASLTDQINGGSPVELEVLNPISEHEYAIKLKL